MKNKEVTFMKNKEVTLMKNKFTLMKNKEATLMKNKEFTLINNQEARLLIMKNNQTEHYTRTQGASGWVMSLREGGPGASGRQARWGTHRRIRNTHTTGITKVVITRGVWQIMLADPWTMACRSRGRAAQVRTSPSVGATGHLLQLPLLLQSSVYCCCP